MAAGRAEQDRDGVGDPEPDQQEAEDGGHGLRDQQHGGEREGDDRHPAAQQRAGADAHVEPSPPSLAIAIPSEKPAKPVAAADALEPRSWRR